MTKSNQPKKINLNISVIKSTCSAEEALEDELEDLYWCEIAKERRNGKMIAVKLEDL
jgi:nitrate reductase NapAB chaperone NapD